MSVAVYIGLVYCVCASNSGLTHRTPKRGRSGVLDDGHSINCSLSAATIEQSRGIDLMTNCVDVLLAVLRIVEFLPECEGRQNE